MRQARRGSEGFSFTECDEAIGTICFRIASSGVSQLLGIWFSDLLVTGRFETIIIGQDHWKHGPTR